MNKSFVLIRTRSTLLPRMFCSQPYLANSVFLFTNISIHDTYKCCAVIKKNVGHNCNTKGTSTYARFFDRFINGNLCYTTSRAITIRSPIVVFLPVSLRFYPCPITTGKMMSGYIDQSFKNDYNS